MTKTKEMEVCGVLINQTCTELLRAHAILWATAQVLTENNDNTVNAIELQSRISLALELVAKYLRGVYDFLGDIEPMVNTGQPPEEILKRLRQATGRG